jgi:V8-like Glu-specific endopeptidase
LKRNNKPDTLGTGFLIQNDLVLTAAHNFKFAGKLTEQPTSILFYIDGKIKNGVKVVDYRIMD